MTHLWFGGLFVTNPLRGLCSRENGAVMGWRAWEAVTLPSMTRSKTRPVWFHVDIGQGLRAPGTQLPLQH